MQLPKPNVQRTLLNPAESWWTGLSAVSDRSIHAMLQMETNAGRHQRSVYELFAEMELKDGHLFSVLQTRQNGLLGLERRLVGGTAASQAHAAEAMRRIPGFDQLLRALLGGIARGIAVVELVWSPTAEGRHEVVAWVEHRPEHVAIGPDGALRLLVPPFDPTGESVQTDSFSGQQWIDPAPRKFLVLRFQNDARYPYGRGLCHHAYWYYFFKKNALKFWAIFNERFGSPTAVARVGQGIGPDDRRELGELLAGLHGEAGVVVPDAVQLSLLEAARSGEGATFRTFLDWCNDEMSKIVLGATLTSSEGRRSGSLALGRVHETVRQDYIESDARLLESVLNDQLLRWITEVGLGPGVEAPRVAIRTETPVDLEASLAVDRTLLALGLRLPESWFSERYGRPLPASGEPTLRYDDANFYQYHLQYGVLTVNEVRARLGLGAVPWGNRRTATTGAEMPPAAPSSEDVGRTPI